MSDNDTKLPVRRLTLSDRVDSDSVGKVIASILDINEKDSADKIELWISSHGGSIDDGFALIDVMNLSTIPIDTVATGSCMSMGVPILQSGKKRYATKHTRIMIHPAQGGSAGRLDEVYASAKDGLKLEKRLHKYVAKRVGMSYEEYLKLMGDSNFMTPSKALKLNFIDAIKRKL